ncbi:hypothetical protein B0W47_01145 [Komagataeibacter nataicola]|uniref:Uncharacterized protein n=1 Tax=Komagataeibacter nataicola TaxID=265960 RepID=A0A9N7CJF8_9PROT|nr:hypothetical protein [Komagataeibacter nataicola]AQU86288.1 hypothetical protein B0W47_01145 [Komagataeibacter nataicola]PYD66527.1 hypothetical protein CDI09_07305 [Komagataeibacter nataicola]WEQ56842.1 hypothetical protein LV564_07165 [Komagataeibacter nataicola]
MKKMILAAFTALLLLGAHGGAQAQPWGWRDQPHWHAPYAGGPRRPYWRESGWRYDRPPPPRRWAWRPPPPPPPYPYPY